jgi:hypothetical protein
MYINPKNVQKWIGIFEFFLVWKFGDVKDGEWYLINFFMGMVCSWLVLGRMRRGVGGDLAL